MKPDNLSASEIALVVSELTPLLTGRFVGKIYDRGAHTLAIELGPHRLVLSVNPLASRLHLETERPTNQAIPSPFVMLLRKRLGGHRLTNLTIPTPGDRIVRIEFSPAGYHLIAELTGLAANLFLIDSDGKITASFRRSSKKTALPGSLYALPEFRPATALLSRPERFGRSPGVADRVASHYETSLAVAAAEEMRQQATSRLSQEILRLTRKREALRKDLARVGQTASFRKFADLILAHSHELPPRGAEWVTLNDDFEDGIPITIPLDAKIDAIGNATRYYKKYQRLTQGGKQTESRLAQTQRDLEEKELALQAVLAAPIEAIPGLVGQRPPSSVRPPQNSGARLPYHQFCSASGRPILVGRSARDNDELTFRHSRGNDVWLHVRDGTGSHVVIPSTNLTLDEDTLLDAATLTAHFSSLGKEHHVDVSYTHVKYVRKSHTPGAVFLSNVKTLHLRMEPSRLERLLRRDH